MGASTERRSRRPVKRKTDEDFGGCCNGQDCAWGPGWHGLTGLSHLHLVCELDVAALTYCRQAAGRPASADYCQLQGQQLELGAGSTHK